MDHAFDLAGDHVAVGEVGVVEDGAEEALGKQVLDQHLFDRLLRQIRVDRLTALAQKTGKGGGERRIAAPLLLDQLRQALADIGHPVLELGDGLLPGGVLLRAEGEEGLERLDQLRGVGQVGVERHAPVLPEDGTLGRLEEDIVARVAGRELALDLRGQVVVDILGFPVAVGEAEIVDQGAVDDDAFVTPRADGMFEHEGPAALTGAVFEEGLEGGTHRGFVGDAKLGELVEGGVVGFDGLVGGFEVEGGHSIGWVRAGGLKFSCSIILH